MNTLLLQQDAGVLHVTLNRPAQRNAMSMHMVRELREVLASAETDGRTRVLVLRGAEGHFCAGGDLSDMARARASDDTRAALLEVSMAFGELCVAYSRTPLATVAVLEGTVMGGGFGLACVADVALAGTTAVFRLPETSLGVVPAQIAAFLVERLGYSQAKRLAVSATKLDAAAALRLGLVHEVHADQDLPAALTQTLQQILQCAPGAVAQTKKLLQRARHEDAAVLVADAATVFVDATLGPEGIEGTTAFLSKRKPKWAPA